MASRRAPQRRPDKQPSRPVRRSYLFPVLTMITALLVGFSSFLPGSVFSAFAAEDDAYFISITSTPGTYSFKVSDGETVDITLPGERATSSLNEENGIATFTVHTDETVNFMVSSPTPIDMISFDEGADEVTSIDCNSSKIAQIDVSKCTNLQSLFLKDTRVSSLDISGLNSLSYVNAIHTPFATFENAFALETGNPEGLSISVNPPVYSAGDDCIEFDVEGLGDKSKLTLTLNDSTPVTLQGDKFSIPNSKLNAIYNAEQNESKSIFVTAQNSAKPQNAYYFDIFPEDLPDSSILAPKASASGSGEEGGNEGGNTGNEGGSDDEETQPVFTDLTIDANSKSIIKKASMEKTAEIDPKNYKIVAKAPTAANKKTFLADIKKADKDFNDSDSNLMVYDIYLVDSKGKKVSVKDKSIVTVVLAYPSKEVSGLSTLFDFKAYHQLDNKTIDTSIEATNDTDGIMFITDSFSLFAISCTRKAQQYTDLVIADNSKNVIKAAKAHENSSFSIENGTEYGGEDIMISAAVPSDEEKKEFLAAIKKADKNFNDKDANLMVYKINLSYIPQDTAAQLVSGRVDFTLAYPNDTVKKNYSKFNYTVYHQKADKSVDTKQVAIGTGDGVMITTDSFSMFAVSSTAKSSGNNPGTGEASVSSNIALLLALLSMVSFAGVYAKNKAEQYSFDENSRHYVRR